MSAPVFLATASEIAQLSVGDTFRLGGSEGHHAAVVQRRAPGEKIDIVDGAGTRLCTIVTAVVGRELDVQVEAVLREVAPHPAITIVQGLVKGGGEEAIAAMTEVGADAILPWQAQRSITRWQGTKAHKAREKWQTTAREAAKQSRRAFVPVVGDVIRNKELADQIRTCSARGGLVLIAHEAATASVAEITELATAQEVWCLIGPEGGISDEEIDTFTQAGGQLLSLGAHVLRAVTAGTVATALLRAFAAHGETQ